MSRDSVKHSDYAIGLGVLSLLMSILYYAPWILKANKFSLLLYVIAFLWFLFVWPALLYFLFVFFKDFRKKLDSWKTTLLGLGLIILSYIIVGIGMANDVFVTV